MNIDSVSWNVIEHCFCYGYCHEGIFDANISVVRSIDQYLFHYLPPPQHTNICTKEHVLFLYVRFVNYTHTYFPFF